MNHDTESFVKLKYELITQDRNTWHLCKTYPEEVRSKWAWRCAGDVEHIAVGHKEAEELIRVAKAYRDGLATKEELGAAYRDAYTATATYYAANATYYAANATYYAANAASNAASYAAQHSARYNYAQSFNKYIGWLVEELCEYENSVECNI